ncbi:DEAD/DEAH box helicase [Oceanobacillus sp. FSL W8-0428]|uniref:DEAD-box ATP-dependent RNA helicase CshB n=1 Tax=Oceanobacillus sojae TaxID=582851 RepID=A0A511ZFW4_9BACI|nr:DEAD/DEAH box helicase [Oceanobacillus sojae]GEN86353.1 DEAD-box ATP-dependent RNA helicase CshB [Oceanobacillus sojae]
MEKTFAELSLDSTMQNIIQELEFRKPTEIQERVIPSILDGKSVIGQSRTGSGKSHAFLLPLFQNLDENQKKVQFVITAPTRELATQLYNEVRKIITIADKTEKWTAKLLVGGTDKQKVVEKLKTPPMIVVGTPGRILDLVKDGALSIYSAETFVIDEADLMLDLGFIEEVDQLLVRSKQEIQLLVFSATIPQRLQHFFKKYLRNPEYIKIEEHFSPETMEHRLIRKKHRDEAKVIWEISQTIHPYLALIFTNGKQQANELAEVLEGYGLSAGVIHGGLTPRERKRVLKEIQQLRYQYVVATDLASRGIDIKGVSHVINAQLPKEEHFYIHRVGRTARAGLEGTAISIYTENDAPLIEKLEQKGLEFSYVEVKQGEWIEDKSWNARQRRKTEDTSTDREAWKQVRKAKKVKPGYKKKQKQQQQQIKRQLTKEQRRKKR